jgi:hypothetical protein
VAPENENNVPINGPILQEKATKIAMRLKAENFKASNGWLDLFKKCHDISKNIVVALVVSTKTL